VERPFGSVAGTGATLGGDGKDLLPIVLGVRRVSVDQSAAGTVRCGTRTKDGEFSSRRVSRGRSSLNFSGVEMPGYRELADGQAISFRSVMPGNLGAGRPDGAAVPSRLMTKRVFILGAGFSVAFSSRMPITDELGELAVARLPTTTVRVPMTFVGGTFEEWLSRLAEDQPDLDEAENFQQRAVFAQLSRAIGDVVEERQREVWWSTPPAIGILLRFVAVMHAWRSTVVSFNYDTLVEQAVDEHCLWDWEANRRAEHSDALDHMPMRPAANMRWAESHEETFRLLKLHGSLNWWWVPGDSTGGTINRWVTTGIERPEPKGLAERERELPGRSRFIVPPNALKSAFYANPLTRELWRRAAQAVESADEVYLVGYSLPRTDMVTVGMLRERLTPETRLVVVNPRPEDVCRQLEHLGVQAASIETITGGDCVGLLVDRLERAVSADLAEELAATKPVDGAYVAVSWGTDVTAAVTDITTENGILVLGCTLPGPSFDTPANSGGPQPKADLELIAAVRATKPSMVVARFPNGRQVVLAQTGILHEASGRSLTWRALNPSVPRSHLPD
jgi:hypothetical protein